MQPNVLCVYFETRDNRSCQYTHNAPVSRATSADLQTKPSAAKPLNNHFRSSRGHESASRNSAWKKIQLRPQPRLALRRITPAIASNISLIPSRGPVAGDTYHHGVHTERRCQRTIRLTTSVRQRSPRLQLEICHKSLLTANPHILPQSSSCR